MYPFNRIWGLLHSTRMLVINAYVLMWPIQKYNSARGLLTNALSWKEKLFKAKELNDRQTIDGINSTKFKASLSTEYGTYYTPNKCLNTPVVILPIAVHLSLFECKFTTNSNKLNLHLLHLFLDLPTGKSSFKRWTW